MSRILSESWFVWALAIVAGFPLAAAVLGQLLGVAERRKLSVVNSLWYALNILLPVTAFYLIFRYVADTSAENTGTRTLLTIALVLAIYLIVAVFNAAFFGGAPQDSWRARTPKLLRDIILGLMVVVGGAVVASQVWDQNVAGIFTALGIGSVILGFALQETLGNVMLGLSLLMERPFLEGDTVKIGGTEGKVEEINWRATRVSSGGDVIIIPHAVAARETITNYSRPNPETSGSVILGFGYEHSPNHVKAMLQDAAKSISEVVASSVAIDSYGDSAINYTTSFTVADPGLKGGVKDKLLTRIWYSAQRSGITIPNPIRTVHHFDGKDAVPDLKKAAFDRLASTTLFAGLSLDNTTINQWVKDAKLQHYSSGEVVVQQGDQVPYFYVVAVGKATLSCKRDKFNQVDLYTLERGDFFGETTLLSGADCPYAVTADGDLQVMSLAVADVRRLIEKKPSLSKEIGQIVDIRRKAVAKAMAG